MGNNYRKCPGTTVHWPNSPNTDYTPYIDPDRVRRHLRGNDRSIRGRGSQYFPTTRRTGYQPITYHRLHKRAYTQNPCPENLMTNFLPGTTTIDRPADDLRVNDDAISLLQGEHWLQQASANLGFSDRVEAEDFIQAEGGVSKGAMDLWLVDVLAKRLLLDEDTAVQVLEDPRWWFLREDVIEMRRRVAPFVQWVKEEVTPERFEESCVVEVLGLRDIKAEAGESEGEYSDDDVEMQDV